MPKTVRPATAGAVTRTLVAAGMEKATSYASGMVRGWHTYYRGVKSEEVMIHDRRRVTAGRYADGSTRYTWVSNNQRTGKVRVEWQFSSDSDRNKTSEQRAAIAVEKMTEAAGILRSKGFKVEEHKGSGPYGGMALTVWREDADGKVVVF